MIVLLVLGLMAAFIVAKFAKRDWLGPVISGVVFMLYGGLSFQETPDVFYLGIIVCLMQFLAAYKLYGVQNMVNKRTKHDLFKLL